MRDWIIPIAAAVGLAGLTLLFVLVLHAVMSIMDVRKRLRSRGDPTTDPNWPGKVKRRAF